MVIRALDTWLSERKLVKQCPLSALSGTRLGIDAEHYLHKLLDSRDPVTSDTFTPAIGGAPLTLTAQIDKDMEALGKLGIKPVFVFDGMNPLDRPENRSYDESTWRRTQAWDHYENGRVQPSRAEFGESNSIVPKDVLRLVHRLFKQRSYEFVVAPYLAWAQLAYLERHERGYVHAIYGAEELFMFDGIDRIILDIDFKRLTISFASKANILSDMGLSSDQFLDLAILAGFSTSMPFPAIDPREFHLRSVVEVLKTRGSGVNAVLAFKDFPRVYQSNYVDVFARARCMIKFSLVLVAHEGRVLPLPLVAPPPPPSAMNPQPTPIITSADIPSDLGEIFSSHLPDEVYYQLFRGMMSPQVIAPLASGIVYEQPPLCGGSPEYERYIKTLNEPSQSPRCVSIALLSNVLHPVWFKKPVSAVYYFQPQAEHPIPHSAPHTQAFIESVSKWNVHARYVEDELRRQASSTIDLCLCLGGTSTASLAQRTIVARNNDRPLDKKDEIVANTLWRFLELRSFLTSAHQHTPHASALHLVMKNSKVNDKFQEPLFLAMELLRANMLHNGRIGTRAYSGGPNFSGGTDGDKRSMLLVMRVLSIVPLVFTPGAWDGPLSRELLVFNSFIRATSRSMRTLLEAIAVNFLLRGDAKRSYEDYLGVAFSLPFQTDTNTGMGILFKAFGDTVCHMTGGIDGVARAGSKDASAEDKAAIKETKDQVLTLLQDAFPNVKNVRAELERGFRFWSLMMLAVRSLRQSPSGAAISPDVAEQFEHADQWLKPFLVQ
ncbi:Mkt1p [Sporobolomyces koalae]|uniref:Mkt1p n=1 Tax=Sporobolomyces koalae TaxID=500713 RepID=UPI0031740F2D